MSPDFWDDSDKAQNVMATDVYKRQDKYLVPKKDFGKLEIKEGKEYKIFTDDIVLTSYPEIGRAHV